MSCLLPFFVSSSYGDSTSNLVSLKSSSSTANSGSSDCSGTLSDRSFSCVSSLLFLVFGMLRLVVVQVNKLDDDSNAFSASLDDSLMERVEESSDLVEACWFDDLVSCDFS